MSLVEYAKLELTRAGLLDQDSDYDGMIGESVLELVGTFAKQGHSGGSAMVTLAVFDEVARYHPLTEITSDPGEWMHIEEDMAGDAITWQSIRKPTLFSKDGGKTWYDLDDPEHKNWPPHLARTEESAEEE